ncbi:hypothetical protein U9M48_044349 [Paspalum notatum var. saurae]|uniref:Uncharacterized protein n=1 Tax=Paspalum notatum var. saurae TaxID=547442 RepID=A0AAQ3XJH9_PASNO
MILYPFIFSKAASFVGAYSAVKIGPDRGSRIFTGSDEAPEVFIPDMVLSPVYCLLNTQHRTCFWSMFIFLAPKVLAPLYVLAWSAVCVLTSEQLNMQMYHEYVLLPMPIKHG